MTAISCGDQACLYRGASFRGIEGALSIAGDCGQYAGLDGSPTRPFNGPPGSCKVKYEPGVTALVWPGGYQVVDYFKTTGSSVEDGKSFLIGSYIEIFRLTVTATDPLGQEPQPGSAFAVKAGANPLAADCVPDLPGYLPDRIAPDCIILSAVGNYFYNAVPDGDWDVLAFKSAIPTGMLHALTTPWKPKRVTMAGVNQDVEILRVQHPQLSITAVLLGNDDQLSVDEDGIVHVVVAASSSGVEGELHGIGFLSSNPIRQDGPTGTVTISTPPPPPPYGFVLAAGAERSFDIPIRGVSAGAVDLIAQAYGQTPLFEDRNAKQTITIQVTTDPPPPPPTEACGFDVLTYVASTSTGATLEVQSASTIGAGTELIIDPCAPNAELVTATVVQGTTLTVAPVMRGAHVTNAPIIRVGGNETILSTASVAGATELDVLRSDTFEVGDGVRIDAGTAHDETATVTGFGSIVVDPPLEHPHAIGASVLRLAACSPRAVDCSTTTTLSGCPAECGDANEDDAITASDALVALKAAVGQRECLACICDANASGTITASDALTILRFAVGAPASLSCPAAG